MADLEELRDAQVKQAEGKAEMYENFGCAAIVLALCLGIGACSMMENIGHGYRHAQEQQR